MCDYFVVTEAETVIQVRAITEAIIAALEEANVAYRRREGWEDARWVLLDYGDVVVHVFRKEEREFYDLERLWGDAPKLTSEQLLQLAAQQG
jgi:ribosome-associated protein